MSLGSRFLAKQTLFQTARQLAEQFAQEQPDAAAARARKRAPMPAQESKFIRYLLWNLLPTDIKESHLQLSEMVHRHTRSAENGTARGTGYDPLARPPRPPNELVRHCRLGRPWC